MAKWDEDDDYNEYHLVRQEKLKRLFRIVKAHKYGYFLGVRYNTQNLSNEYLAVTRTWLGIMDIFQWTLFLNRTSTVDYRLRGDHIELLSKKVSNKENKQYATNY